jgi:hypothetical protein
VSWTNHLPIAQNEQFLLHNGNKTLIGAVLQNDTPGDSRHPQVKLVTASGQQVNSLTNPGVGVFEVTNDEIRWTLDKAFAGAQTSVQCVIIDDNNGAAPPETSNVATATFSLPNYTPEAEDEKVTIVEGEQAEGFFKGSDRETPADQLTYRFLDAGAPQVDPATRHWIFPPGAALGTYTFHFVVNDGSQDSEPAILTIEVTPAQ